MILAGGVSIAAYQLNELRRDRHLHWITEISQRWNEDKLEESRIALSAYDSSEVAGKVKRWLRREDENEAEMIALLRLPEFFEDVALGVERGRIDLSVVWQSLSGPVSKWWAYWEESVVVFRETDVVSQRGDTVETWYRADPEAFSQFQRLARDLADYERRAHETARWRSLMSLRA